MSDFLKDIIKTTGNEYAALVSDGVEAGDVENFIDTGSYVFNALLSGSVYGGLPANKITALAGESATGIRTSLWVLSRTSLMRIQIVVLYTSRVRVRLPSRWL